MAYKETKTESNCSGIKCILEIVVVMILLQLARIGIESVIFLFVGRTRFADHAATAVAMLILTVLILMLARFTGRILSLFPEKFSLGYFIETIIFLGMFITTAVLFCENTADIFFMVYASIITPLFEELVFRGYAWNRLESALKKEFVVYIINAALFAIWHLGYWDGIALKCDGDAIYNIMFWKMIIGLGYGIILGAVRCKTRNCYSTILLHGFMNIFGR